MRLVKTFAIVAFATLVAVACGKGPAQAALSAADAAVSSARPDGENFVPEQFQTLSDTAADARSKFDSGDYKGALEGAQAIPAQAEAVMQAVVAKKAEVMNTWKNMEGSLPGMIADVTKKVEQLSGGKKLPAGLDKAALESVVADLEGATTGWAEAGAAFGAGDVMAATTKAGDVHATVAGLMATLGMPPPAPMMEAEEAAPAEMEAEEAAPAEMEGEGSAPAEM